MESLTINIQMYSLSDGAKVATLPLYPEGFHSWGTNRRVEVQGFTRAVRLDGWSLSNFNIQGTLTEGMFGERTDSWILYS